MNNKFIIGQKIGMTQLFLEDGKVVPATVLEVSSCQLIKISSGDAGAAALVSYGEVSEKKLNKPKLGLFKKLKANPARVLKEFSILDPESFDLKEGDKICVDRFSEGDYVDVRGKTIGKGFAGTIKRWNFSRGPMSHGSKSHRIPGSIGGGTTPGRVIKGKKMPGQLGNVYQTVKRLKVLRVDVEKNLIFLMGSIPGKKKNIVQLTSS